VLRTDHGINYPGWYAVLCFVLMLLVASGADDPEPVQWFIGLWLCCLVAGRLRAWNLFRRGMPVGGTYSGYPARVATLLPAVGTVVAGVGRERRAKAVEAVACLAGSWLLADATPSLGKLLVAGAFGLWVTRLLEAYAGFRLTVGMRDASIRMRQAAMRYRGEW